MKRTCPTNAQYIAVAKALYHEEGTREIDDKAKVSKAPGNPEQGAYVQAWVWISDDEVRDYLKEQTQ